MAQKLYMKKRKCLNCNVEFDVNVKSPKKFCSLYCANHYRLFIEREERPCEECGKLMTVRPKDDQRFCSVKCLNENKWKRPEYRKTISESLKLSWQDPERIEKNRTAMRAKWAGPEFRSKMYEIMSDEKWLYNHKKYTLPSGKDILVMGNEPLVLDQLFSVYDESEIAIQGDIEKYTGKIFYAGPDNNEHIYIPDIYIIPENKIIEVKSQFTYNINPEINELKKNACINSGIDFEFIII